MGKQWKQWQTLFSWGPKLLKMVTVAMKLKGAFSLEEKLWPTWQHIKKQRHYFANKGPPGQSHGFSSSHVWMWELDYKDSWAPKNWYFWTVVLEKTLESPLDCKEIQPVHPKGNQPWIFIGRTDAEAESPILWPPDGKNWFARKRPWCWERLKAGKGDDRGWDGWMASLTRWIWVWVSSRSWWWTGKPDMLQSTGLHRVGYDWATKPTHRVWGSGKETDTKAYLPESKWISTFSLSRSLTPLWRYALGLMLSVSACSFSPVLLLWEKCVTSNS